MNETEMERTISGQSLLFSDLLLDDSYEGNLRKEGRSVRIVVTMARGSNRTKVNFAYIKCVYGNSIITTSYFIEVECAGHAGLAESGVPHWLHQRQRKDQVGRVGRSDTSPIQG